MMTLADITSDTATLEDFIKQREQEVATKIFADLDKVGIQPGGQLILFAHEYRKIKEKYIR